MKKAVLGLFFFVLCLSVFAQTDQGAGVIRQLSGTVELKHAGAADFVAAGIGDQVRQDTVVSTGFRSSALIAVGNSALITVQPLTRLTLVEISAAAGTETLNTSLQAGRVRIDVNPPAGTRASMSVSSPTATASVRGTTVFFDGKNLGVTGGTVAFQGSRGPGIQVGNGFSAGLDSTGKPSNPVFSHVNGGGSQPSGGGLAPTGQAGSDPSSGASILGSGSFLDTSLGGNGNGNGGDPGGPGGPGGPNGPGEPGGPVGGPGTLPPPPPPTTGDINIEILY